MTLKSFVYAIIMSLISHIAIADDSMSILINQKLYASAYKPDTMRELINAIDSASQQDSSETIVIVSTTETY